MKIEDFDYHLPEELIAQHRLENRDESRLLVLSSDAGITDSHFYELDKFLEDDSLVVFNNSKVIKAFLILTKGDKEIGVNLNKPLNGALNQGAGSTLWSGFAKPAKKLSEGDIFDFGGHKVIIKQKLENGEIVIEFALNDITVFDFLDIFGHVPLPPYIRDGIAIDEDEEKYQTIFSETPGSVAAPTAGLHFTDHVFVQLKKKNIDFCFVTLHVGAGTYLPVKDSIESHVMHSEFGEITEDAASKINEAKKQGRKIIAVGTTSVRTLEASAENDGIVYPGQFETNIFIKPGFEFKIVDQLITNFHMPKSTLMLLVSAFAGYDNIIKAYNHAVEEKYRFFSYGDATLLSKQNKKQ